MADPITNIEELRAYCMHKTAVEESMPFDDTTLVFKVGNKMFALVALDAQPLRINLKCDPERAQELREKYDNIIPGYHMNKKHWNTVIIDRNLPPGLLTELIDHSYELVWNSLSKAKRKSLESR